MSTIPDFVPQVHEVEKNLKAEWNSVQEGWRDNVSDGFNNGVMTPYLQIFQQYVTGDGLSGYGLEQILQQMDRHLQEMNSLTN